MESSGLISMTSIHNLTGICGVDTAVSSVFFCEYCLILLKVLQTPGSAPKSNYYKIYLGQTLLKN